MWWFENLKGNNEKKKSLFISLFHHPVATLRVHPLRSSSFSNPVVIRLGGYVNKRTGVELEGAARDQNREWRQE